MDHLERLAQRVSSDPLFLAFALTLYSESEQLNDDALASRLACPRENLSMLRLCRTPDPEPVAFGRDIDQIAARFGANAGALAEAVRRGQVLARFRAAAVQDRGTLLAARDDDPSETQP
jgi:hypothetical protein